MPKTSSPPADSRTRVIAEAKRLFADRGFDAVSMAVIADAVGIQKASLYYFFKSKEDIYLAIVADVIENTMLGITRELAATNKRLLGDRDSGRREMARLLSKFIRLASHEGMVVRPIDIAFMKTNADCCRVRASIEQLHEAFLAFFIKHDVEDPTMALEVCVNSVRAYVINRRLGLDNRVTPTRYANYLAGLLIK